LYVNIAFEEGRATMRMEKSGQYVFDGMAGWAIGIAEPQK